MSRRNRLFLLGVLVGGILAAFVLAALHRSPLTFQPQHNHDESATCAGGLTASASFYQGGTLVMRLGAVTYSASFGDSYSHTIANPDQTKPQTWRVTVVSTDGTGGFDVTGTIQACKEPVPSTSPPTSAPVATSVAPSTTTVTSTLAPPVSSSTSASVPPVASSRASAATTTTPATATKTPTLIPRTR